MRKYGCGCVVVFFGLVLLGASVGGAFWLANNLNRAATNETTSAAIVELIEGRDSDGDTTYRPVVEYVVDGVTYRLESRVSYGGALVPDIGDVRTVYYDPDDPADAVFRSFWTFWFFPILLTTLPALVVVLLVWLNLAQRHRSREAVGAPVPGSPAGEPAASHGSPPSVIRIPGANRIEADFMGAEPSQMDAAGRVRYRIRAQAEVDGRMRRFLGSWLDRDPTIDLMRAGNKVTVYLDPENPGRYQIDYTPADE
jgi:hypothetical protein